MGCLKAMLVVLLALVWAPLTSHCQWESLTGLEVFQCTPGHHEDDAAPEHCDASCCAAENSDSMPAGPDSGLARVLIPDFQPARDAAFASLGIQPASETLPAVAPPDPRPPARPWPFLLRMAPAPRAPSVVG